MDWMPIIWTIFIGFDEYFQFPCDNQHSHLFFISQKAKLKVKGKFEYFLKSLDFSIRFVLNNFFFDIIFVSFIKVWEVVH